MRGGRLYTLDCMVSLLNRSSIPENKRREVQLEIGAFVGLNL